MKNKNVVSKKLLCAALLGAFCVAPVTGVMPAAHADPPHMHRAMETFTGVVTNIISDQEFDIRMSGKIYNVYPQLRTPRLLRKGDIVSINGRRVGRNDIRHASVTVVRGEHHHDH